MRCIVIEQLSQLVSAAGVERMNLSIQSHGNNDQVDVVIQCVFGREPEKSTGEQKKLRSVLSTPIRVSGYVGEVDVKLDDLLYRYVHSVKPSLDQLTTDIEAIADKANGVQADTVTACKEQSTPVIPTNNVNEDALTNGEADSL
tara:strand:+ start:21716 stop:22147 length:432 start_codon:yes stop_codon:yes gene_type:complete